MEHCVEFISGN